MGQDLQRALTDHRLQFIDHLPDAQRFAEEAAVGRPFRIGWFHLAGNEDDLDSGPTVMHGVSQLQSVHAARHLNIGEQQIDVRAGLQNGDCLVGVHGFNGSKSGILHNIDRAHSQYHFVLDDENVGHLG